ncbi:vitamin K epoxide reductase family protein [Pedobacter endophyticus]|uniref:Peptidase C39 domain-containing protein n=1 Tax=Pedobacter endophyticus TaxID=2789740 RepID=A0A7S9KY45_9SPHI|nr:vitamin K epoxide reductase family protein [Pedobacter endophyticus]QPH38950.1 hypothetical protein IZT61_18080 [Pedobacter endophyticus]
MTNFFKRLIEPTPNGPEVADLIVRLIGAKISKTTLKKEIEEHPDYPSLLSIRDVFTSHGIDNIALKIDPDTLTDSQDPFIVQLKGNKKDDFFFSVVREIKSNQITYFDPQIHAWTISEQGAFLEKITGIVLLIEGGAEISEKDYDKKRQAEKQKKIAQYAGSLCIPILSIVLGIYYFLQGGFDMILPFVYLLLTLTGCGITILLIWYELDRYNPILNQICTGGKKINCGAILQSNGSKIVGFSWSSIGFSYFNSILLILILGGLENKIVLFMLSWVNILVMPYLIFSIYYQWRVAKQWCILCLSVLAIMTLQALAVSVDNWYGIYALKAITIGHVIQGFFAFTFSLAIINIIIVAFQKAKANNDNLTRLQKLKNNPVIFKTLLMGERKITINPENLGITLGNPRAKYKIIKVCNPYCGPCANAHKPLENLLQENDDLQIQILFTASNDINDIKNPPVKHFLALAEKYDEEHLKKALDDWYLSDVMDYKSFAAKHPIHKELKYQVEKIDMMKNWCDKIQIDFTPTFFISMNDNESNIDEYFQMPSLYSPNDFKYFFLQ